MFIQSVSYALYLIISIGLTIWVARTLSKNGEVFLTDCFGHDAVLARSTNHLLVVGFYLVNLGFILLALRFGTPPENVPDAIRFLSSKVGLAVLVLGGMHFFNMNAIAKFGRKVGTWFREGQWLNEAGPNSGPNSSPHAVPAARAE